MTIESGTEKLLVSLDDGIARVTFNNPAKRNALSAEMREALPSVLRGLRDDAGVRVVVVTGAGTASFVAGADISEFGDLRTSPEARAAYDRTAAEAAAAWDALGKPVIAMIRGWCIGGGLLTALQADLRIAADDSRFGVPAARLGLGSAPANVEALAAVVGPAHAADLLLTARYVDAAEAARLGLVNRVVPATDLEHEVLAQARAIAANAPLTIAAITAALRDRRRPAPERDRALIDALVEACWRSEDYAEGRQAFADKRPPVFRGR